MSAEFIVFSDLSDVSITLGREFGELLDRNVPVQFVTDNKSLILVISKAGHTSEKRTMLDIAANREAFLGKVISDIGFV